MLSRLPSLRAGALVIDRRKTGRLAPGAARRTAEPEEVRRHRIEAPDRARCGAADGTLRRDQSAEDARRERPVHFRTGRMSCSDQGRRASLQP